MSDTACAAFTGTRQESESEGESAASSVTDAWDEEEERCPGPAFAETHETRSSMCNTHVYTLKYSEALKEIKRFIAAQGQAPSKARSTCRSAKGHQRRPRIYDLHSQSSLDL